MSNKNVKLLTSKDVYGDENFPYFKNDKERIRKMSNLYRNMSVSKAFDVFYNLNISKDTKENSQINSVSTIELGKVYLGTVNEISPRYMTFSVPGAKEELISKEDFTDCMESLNAYLLLHDNKLLFEVREKKDNKYYVSVINGYYKTWVEEANKAIQYGHAVQVHIDDLVQGGYLAHTPIYNINEVTGRNYTHSVFIPGSHIVLNIERDFEKWIGQDVTIIPQKFVDFKKNYKTGEIEKSMVGSRKMVLQKIGNHNLEEMYNRYMLAQKNENVTYEAETLDGTVTGIINADKKTGIFVELDGKYITGLMPISSLELLDYKPGDKIKVQVKEFEVKDGKEPFTYNKRGTIVKCNTRAVFTRVA